MKILITGGNGFIARNLFEGLNGEYALVSRSSAELDLLDSREVFEYIKGNRFDVIIHTATYDAAPKHSAKDPAKVMENNLKMFFNLVRCNDRFGRMIYYGSGAEFKRENWIPKMKEDYFDRYVPQDQYGFSKYIMNKYTQLSTNIYNLRLFAVFGKYEDWRVRFISNACCRAALGLPITVNQNVFFDYMYIDDLINITKWFIENAPHEKTYNICTARAFSHLELARKVSEISGKNPEIIIKDRGAGIEYSGDNSRLMDEIGGYDFKDMDSSIEELYNWYSANKFSIDKEKLLACG
ncbi:MAG: NAD(P)-dependent oxidoreductase [Candidatus Omnitrophica bacterium]|nr:NAD(P)-dependent oxidoreductase [Candidatus Omnitrophota bacterium]